MAVHSVQFVPSIKVRKIEAIRLLDQGFHVFIHWNIGTTREASLLTLHAVCWCYICPIFYSLPDPSCCMQCLLTQLQSVRAS